eukprot:1062500-Pyramimonas_sp.AAC.1
MTWLAGESCWPSCPNKFPCDGSAETAAASGLHFWSGRLASSSLLSLLELAAPAHGFKLHRRCLG